MNNSNEIKQQMGQEAEGLMETTFGEVHVGRSYLTPAGHRVEVIEVVPDSHAIVLTTKGREMRIPADKICRGPLPVSVDEADVNDDDHVAATKRRPKMTIDELRAEYLRTTGHETGSTNRRYLMWRLSPAGLRRIHVGPLRKPAARDRGDMQVLPFGILRETARLLDTAVKAAGIKSRSTFIRAALVEKLRVIGSDEANAAADALVGETG